MSFAGPVRFDGRCDPGSERQIIPWEGVFFGNNNYQNTGDLYTAQQFGMSGITTAYFEMRDNTNTYFAAPIFPTGIDNSTSSRAIAANNFNLHWYSANGVEVANNANLSASAIRGWIRGL